MASTAVRAGLEGVIAFSLFTDALLTKESLTLIAGLF
jgi:hypothetical protein